MRRVKRTTGAGLEHFDVLHDGDHDLDRLAEMLGRPRSVPPAGRDAKLKAAWQRVDERREIEALKAQLEDWEDWDPSWSDDGAGERFGVSRSS